MAETLLRRTPRDLIRMVFRWPKLFFASAALFAIAALIVADRIPVRYTSTTRFERRVDETLPEDTLSGVRPSEAFEAGKQTLMYELGGYNAVERAVNQLAEANLIQPLRAIRAWQADLSSRREDPNAALKTYDDVHRQIIAQYRDSIDIEWDARGRKVDVISVSFTSDDPNIAQIMPEMLVKNYITLASARATQRLDASRDFLLKQVQEAEAKQKEASNRKIEFESKYVGLLAGTSDDMDRRMQQTKADYDAVRRLLALSKRKYDELVAMKERQGAEAVPPTQIIKAPNPEMERLGNELREYKIELDLAMTLRHMTESHPAIQTLLKRIELLEQRIRETPSEIVVQTIVGEGGGADTLSQKIAAAQAEVEVLTMEFDRVESQKVGYEKMMESFSPVRKEYTQLVESVNKLAADTENWYKRLRETDMVLAAEKDNLRIQMFSVEQARREALPSFPRLTEVLLVSFLGAIGFGVLVLFARKMLDRTIVTPEDAAAYFNVPVHGVIGEIVSRGERVARVSWRVVWVLLALVALCFVATGTYNIYLRLENPQKYQKLHQSPTQFMQQQLARNADRIDME